MLLVILSNFEAHQPWWSGALSLCLGMEIRMTKSCAAASRRQMLAEAAREDNSVNTRQYIFYRIGERYVIKSIVVS